MAGFPSQWASRWPTLAQSRRAFTGSAPNNSVESANNFSVVGNCVAEPCRRIIVDVVTRVWTCLDRRDVLKFRNFLARNFSSDDTRVLNATIEDGTLSLRFA